MDFDGVDGLVEGIALGGDGFLHPVGAGNELAQLAVAFGIGRDGADLGGEVAVGVDVVDRALEAVAGVRPADPGQGRVLLERYLAVRGVLERQDDLRGCPGVELKSLEVLGHLARARGDQAPRGVGIDLLAGGPEADDVLAHPLLEVLGAAVKRIAAVRCVGVGDEDVGERGVVVVVHGGPVVPPARPEGRVEARRAVSKPEVGRGLGRASGRGGEGRPGVVPGRGRRGGGVGAVGHLAVRPHPGGRITAVVDARPDGQLRRLGRMSGLRERWGDRGEKAGEREQHGEERPDGRGARGRADDVRFFHGTPPNGRAYRKGRCPRRAPRRPRGRARPALRATAPWIRAGRGSPCGPRRAPS